MFYPFVFLGWLLALTSLPAQDRARLDSLRIASGELSAPRFGPLRWIDAAHYATLEPGPGKLPELVRYAAVTGTREVLVAANRLQRPDASMLRIEDYQFSPDGRSVLLFSDSERVWRQNTRGEFHVLGLHDKKPLRRLGGALPTASLQFAKWSPTGDRIAYVAQNDLYVEPAAGGPITRLTHTGSKTLIHGTFDWVYEEEFDCRDGFRWSPDGQRIAYWQLDCSGVGEFYMIDNLSDRYSRILPVQFPKAGTTNSACRIGVIPAAGGETVWMQTPGDPRETYLPRMEWHPAGRELAIQWLPRAQNRLQILAAEVATGAIRTVHEETDEAYIDVREDLRFLDQGQRLFWTSDTAFHRGEAPRYRQCGTLEWNLGAQQVLGSPLPWTSGFDTIAVAHLDPARSRLWVLASPHNATQQYLHAATPGGGLQRLSPLDQAGWHEYDISPDGALAIHTFSAFHQPPVVDLVRLPSHERVSLLAPYDGLRERFAAVAKGKHEFFQVSAGGGVVLDGWAMYPPEFRAEQRWPVVFHVYGEPWSQTVKDTWSLGHHLFHLWLTQQGYVVMSLDARGTPAPKGRDWRKALYQQIGIRSTADWASAVASLRQQHAWMDAERSAIWGWSGGGAMTLNLMFRQPGLFAAGIAVAPVTDIALYDTIYQERYCGDPRLHPEVYRECSPITFAGNLAGQLLLVHGTGDDNVHFQHSERLFDALVAAGKLFEYLAYPNRSHAIHEGKGTRQHLYAAMADFLRRRVPAGGR